MTNTPSLYGQPDDEYLTRNLDDAIEWAVEAHGGLEDREFEIVVTEFSTLPKGDAVDVVILSAEDILEHIVDHFRDQCTIEELDEQYWQAAREEDVLAAFRAARELLVSKQTILCAGDEIAKHHFLIHRAEDGNYSVTPSFLNPEPT